jgi:hypothetical protein
VAVLLRCLLLWRLIFVWLLFFARRWAALGRGAVGDPFGDGRLWPAFDLDLACVVATAEYGTVVLSIFAGFTMFLLQSCEVIVSWAVWKPFVEN